MRQLLSIGNMIAVASLMAISTTSIFLTPTFARQRTRSLVQPNERLQHAVNDIYRNPKVAEQELQKLSSPTAKAYLAFLYMSHKTTLPQPQRKIDSLIRHAIAQVPDKSLLADIDDKDIHCTTMEKLLRYLRFITEADETATVTPPIRIFKQYPDACMSAFAAYYYSSRERALPFELKTVDDIGSISAVKAVFADIDKINGNEDQLTNGTMVYGFYRQQALARLKASLAPQLCFKEMNCATGKRDYKNFSDFIEHWSTQELYNRKNWLALQRDTDKAVAPLAAHYSKHFHLSAVVARKYAEATLKSDVVSWLGSFSQSEATEEINMPIYKVFAPHADSIADLKKRIGQRVMSKPELAEALRLQTLNGGNLEIIDWLLQLGAPVAGGMEPPLFSAVERPEVVALLIKAGANVNETNVIGKTALIQAAQYNALPTIKGLIAAGADINHKMINTDQVNNADPDAPSYVSYSVGRRSALMYAAGFADSSTIDYLVSKGADKTARDSEGWKPAKFLSWNKRISKADTVRMTKELH